MVKTVLCNASKYTITAFKHQAITTQKKPCLISVLINSMTAIRFVKTKNVFAKMIKAADLITGNGEGLFYCAAIANCQSASFFV